MSTENQITEAQVVAFATARLAELRAKFGPKGYVNLRIQATAYGVPIPSQFSFQIGADVLTKDYTGDTFAEAVEKSNEESPQKIAADKRAAAARLIAEAEALAPTSNSIEAATKGTP